MSSKNKFKYEDIFGAELEEASSEMTGVMEHTQINDVASEQIVKGKVTGISKEYVTVDIGSKAEGQIPVPEFMDRKGDINVKVGDELEVYVANMDSKSGEIILSRSKAMIFSAWNKIEKACQDGSNIKAVVTGKMKGGFSLSIDGLRAFMPASQSDDGYHSNHDEIIGKEVEIKVMNLNKEQSNVVVSRRLVLEESKKKLREEMIHKVKEGAVFKGKVRTISEYGAFIDIGGMDGLVHVTDISWGRVKHPGDVVSVGQELNVVVLKYEQERDRLTLGVKQLTKNPWQDISSRYTSGQKVNGRIVGLTDYGAFLELELGVEGMIHISEMSWNIKVKKPSDILKIGDVVDAVILEVNQEKHRIGLGLKQIGTNPWDELKNKYPVGTRLRAQIKNITDFGLFVSIGEDHDGLIRISDITWDTKEQEPLKNYEKGQTIDAVVLDISPERQKISLGIKQLSEDPWTSIPKRLPVGKIIEGTITKVTDFGVFVEVEPSIEGLVHISQLSSEKMKRINPQEFKTGNKISCLVTDIDTKNKKISLSVKAVKEQEEKENIKAFSQQHEDVKVSLGALLKDRLR
ncbi:MAG: 30S ribosomal protein S1 [bacterium]